MDIRAIITFVAHHSDQFIGASLVLILITGMILLIRSIKEKDSDGAGGSATVQIDAATIEEAMKRVLSNQPLTIAAGASAGGAIASGGGADAAAIERMNQALAERDAKIEQMSKELEAMRAQVASAASGGGGGGDGASALELNALKAKLDEMQARLAEYEIIEDDIADLSMFKEENARLKSEIEDLKNKISAIPVAAPAPAAPVAAVAAPAPAPPPPEVKFEKSDKFELDPNDDIMKEFAAAMQVQRAPPTEVSSGIPKAPDLSPLGTDPQAAIDAMLNQAQNELSTKTPVEAPAPAPAPASVDPQAAIDAMFSQADPQDEVDSILAQAEAEAAAKTAAPLDPQAEIDAMLAQAAANAEPAPDPQAEIDAMLAQAAAEPTIDPQANVDAMFAQASEPAAEPAGETPADPQSEIDSILAQAAAESKEPTVAAVPNQVQPNEIEDLLGGTPDPDKMLSEVASLEADSGSEASALEDTLDTDKLLAEVGGLEAEKDKANDGDDLLAEFKS